jgi:mannitol/fructose-specific phosphotransferase system IIA component (Ntr-type)
MKLSDFVIREAIVPGLQATSKEPAIREILDSLRVAGHIPNGEMESIHRAIMKREELGSTGIGDGVAVPHTKHASVARPVGTVALSRDGVAFASLDGEPVHIVFLLVSPVDRPGDHLRALENISRHLRNETFRRFLRQSTTREQLIGLLEEADQNTFSQERDAR